MLKLAKVMLLISILGLIPIGCRAQTHSYKVTTIKLNDCSIQVEIADTLELRRLGVGKRKSLLEGWGMLFVFDRAEYYSFWMKDVSFPLDFIWIKDGEVVDITANVPLPINGKLPGYTPTKPVNYVLEVNAGVADRCGVKVGDKIEIFGLGKRE